MWPASVVVGQERRQPGGALGAALPQLRWSGERTLSDYEPPFTPWFLRRNEIYLALAPQARPGACARSARARPNLRLAREIP